MKLKIQAFGSTSSGNSTLLWTNNFAVLVDCGLGVNYTSRCLAEHNLSFKNLNAVLLTHVHKDHINGYVLQRLVKAGVPLYCNNRHVRHLRRMFVSAREASAADLLKTFRDAPFDLGDAEVVPFEVEHDAPGGTWGYRITFREGSESVAATLSTDLGDTPDSLLPYFTNTDALILESNHNREMLKNSGRPGWLKERIRRAHLSNTECSKFIDKAVTASERCPQAVLLAHISQDCNTNDLALSHAVTFLGHHPIHIYLTHKEQPSEVAVISPFSPAE